MKEDVDKYGYPTDLDKARLLPHLRNRPISKRPPWVEARAKQLAIQAAQS